VLVDLDDTGEVPDCILVLGESLVGNASVMEGMDVVLVLLYYIRVVLDRFLVFA